LHKVKYLLLSVLYPYKPASILSSFIFEKLFFLADSITVSNSFLKARFGGEIIWHARDENNYNPKNYKNSVVRKKYGVTISDKIVLFMGTIRPHKGIETLINSISEIPNSTISLLLVGIDDSLYNKEIVLLGRRKLLKRFYSFNIQPFFKVPEFLSMADVIVIPQKKNMSSMGQMPAKIFDAMAMEKAIISTSVSDIPEVLKGCGIIIDAESQQEMSDAIKSLFEDVEKREFLGEKARNKFIKNYSYSAMREVLKTIINNIK
ncbi:MAG: glycosyltransferase family 4 protein, partial [Romboutsia sp.]|nr:glycosyltransferase family 4 protein [Romboutsia sp.]